MVWSRVQFPVAALVVGSHRPTVSSPARVYGPATASPRRAVGKARHSLKVENVGSSPTGDACWSILRVALGARESLTARAARARQLPATRPHRLEVRSRAFQACNAGSSPAGGTFRVTERLRSGHHGRMLLLVLLALVILALAFGLGFAVSKLFLFLLVLLVVLAIWWYARGRSGTRL
jgi:hypothetical protein